MKKVSELLRSKGSGVLSVSPDASVFEAIELMSTKNVGALLVLKDNKLVGVISERDYARKVFLQGRKSKETRVGDIMADKVIYVKPSDSVEYCMALMTDKHIRHLPVMAEDELVGLVSIGDLVKAVIAEQQYIIEQLENYITGNG